jgi:hypothetical protein
MLTCIRCKLDLPVGAFCRDRRKVNGRSSYCRQCSSEIDKGCYRRKKQRIKRGKYEKPSGRVAVLMRKYEYEEQVLRAAGYHPMQVNCRTADLVIAAAAAAQWKGMDL